MRTIIGLNKPREGEIEVFGQKIGPAESHNRCDPWRRVGGCCFRMEHCSSSQTVAENIQVPLREYTAMSQPLMNEIASMKLTMVGLPEDTAQKYPPSYPVA